MHFESLEHRLLMIRSSALIQAPDFEVADTGNQVLASPIGEVVTPVADDSYDFLYTSERINVDEGAKLISGELAISDSSGFFKPKLYQAPRVHVDGYIVAERTVSDRDDHTMVVAQALNNDCFHVEGVYTLPRNHYLISFDVRHPAAEASWLNQEHWSVVTQLWGPRDDGETARNPPLALLTKSKGGEPRWSISSFGDSRPVTQTGDFEEAYEFSLPYDNVGQWNHWDIEYVPDPQGDGIVRAWLNGELVVEWTDIKTGYSSEIGGVESGPVNPGFGLYGPLIENGMEVHFDNISIQCDGAISRVAAGTINPGNGQAKVSLTNLETQRTYRTVTSTSGVYAVNVPRGVYSLTATDIDTGDFRRLDDLDLRRSGRIVNIETLQTESSSKLPSEPIVTPTPTPETPTSEVSDVVIPPPIPAPVTSPNLKSDLIIADVNADGVTDAIRAHENGTWWVTTSQAGSLQSGDWGSFSTDTGWHDLQAGDFNGDDRDDLVGRDDNGQWWVWRSTGKSFVLEQWGSWSSNATWEGVHVADFTGDGMDDIVGRMKGGDGTWWVATSKGSRFVTTAWDIWDASLVRVDTLIGDFNGDGRSDIAARDEASGWWWVATSTGRGFEGNYWGRWSTFSKWSDATVADVNGDGLDDILGRDGSNLWWVAQSSGDSFKARLFSRWDRDADWSDIVIVDVNGDNRDDLVAREKATGKLWYTIAQARYTNRAPNQNTPMDRLWTTNTNWLDLGVDFDENDEIQVAAATTPFSYLLANFDVK